MQKNKFFNRRAVALLCSVAVALGLTTALCSCNGSSRDDGHISIVCSVFPEYDWVRNVVGDRKNVEVSLLVSNGTDVHSYEATPADMVALKQSDLVISAGGVSDSWIAQALEGEDGVWHMRLCELPQMTLYGMSAQNIGHAHGEDCNGEEHSHGETDEHLWFSLKNAAYAVECISDALCVLDADGADTYKTNAKEYVQRINTLDARMTELASGLAKEKNTVFADRFPFVYLFEDYSLKYFAAFEGCTTDAEADFETIVKLSSKIDELGATCVLITETSDGSLAKSVIENSQSKNATVYVLDSMQSVTADDIAAGASYLGIMEQNILVLTLSFGGAQE